MIPMKRWIVTVVAAAIPAIMLASGDTIGITISGPDLMTPIEIKEGAGHFRVWAGPNTTCNDPQSLIADWAAGAVQPPEGQRVYQVFLRTTRRNGPDTYTVYYTVDTASGNGYVYIPGSDHPRYRDNTWLILYGVEGKWFRAWSEWEKVANPLIDRAPKIH